MKRSMILAGLVALGVSFAHAQSPGVSARQINQQARIQQGVRSGELTRIEAARLQTRQAHIALDKARAKSDGIVTRAERAHVRHEQARASQAIYRQKHDGQTRP